jgi:hypothetical protein
VAAVAEAERAERSAVSSREREAVSGFALGDFRLKARQFKPDCPMGPPAEDIGKCHEFAN